MAEAFQYGARITDLFVTVPARARHDELVAAIAEAGIGVHTVSGEVMSELAQTVTPQGLLAVCGFVDVPLAAVAPARARRWSRCWPTSVTPATPVPCFVPQTRQVPGRSSSPTRPSIRTTASACARPRAACFTFPWSPVPG